MSTSSLFDDGLSPPGRPYILPLYHRSKVPGEAHRAAAPFPPPRDQRRLRFPLLCCTLSHIHHLLTQMFFLGNPHVDPGFGQHFLRPLQRRFAFPLLSSMSPHNWLELWRISTPSAPRANLLRCLSHPPRSAPDQVPAPRTPVPLCCWSRLLPGLPILLYQNCGNSTPSTRPNRVAVVIYLLFDVLDHRGFSPQNFLNRCGLPGSPPVATFFSTTRFCLPLRLSEPRSFL